MNEMQPLQRTVRRTAAVLVFFLGTLIVQVDDLVHFTSSAADLVLLGWLGIIGAVLYLFFSVVMQISAGASSG